MVYVAPSRVTGAGDGLFSRKSVPPMTLLAFYNGFRIPEDVDYTNELFAFDEKKKLQMKTYTIKLGEDEDFYLDMPLDAGLNRSIYGASFGHKVNHSFTPNCKYSTMHHPRWGKVVAVTSTKSISKDEELFCNYAYNPETQAVPDWYRELYNKHYG